MPKTIVVVGASKGIGAAIVNRFAETPDFRVIALARSFQKNPAADQAMVSSHYIDLASDTLRQDVTDLLSEVETIDVLINNAGYIVVKPFLELTRPEIEMAYRVNVIGVMETIQACLPKMKAGSHIVTISSMGGFQGTAKFPGLAAYSTSKAAAASLTELLAEELKETGIKVNCLCLGSVQTEMLETAFPGYKAPINPEEMAEYITGFALNAHRFMNGKIIPVALTTP